MFKCVIYFSTQCSENEKYNGTNTYKSRIDIRNPPENSDTCKTHSKLIDRRCGLDIVSLDFILRC